MIFINDLQAQSRFNVSVAIIDVQSHLSLESTSGNARIVRLLVGPVA